MISFPNAKINIGLNVVSKRDDGYHNLETIFYPIRLSDGLEIFDAKNTKLSCSGIRINGASSDNLVVKAWQLLNKDFKIPPIRFHLHKVIPFGAGLGGGSSDAAFALKMLNEHFNLKLTDEELEVYAAQIGADCPFFIRNKPTFASGTGNQFEKIELDLSAFEIVIVKPNIFVSTPEAFRNIIPENPNFKLTDLMSSPIEDWKNLVVNDFEKSVFPLYPEIEKLKKMLYKLGAEYASMSGSGSAVFGIFRHLPANIENKLPRGIFIYR